MKALTTAQLGDIIIALKSSADNDQKLAVICPSQKEYFERRASEKLATADQISEMRENVFGSENRKARFYCRI